MRWIHHIQSYAQTSRRVPLADALVNQSLFNGVGNWMRAEIIAEAQLPPFDSISTIVNNTQLFRRLVLAIEKVFKRTVTIISNGFDLRSVEQRRAFDDSLLVYGKKIRLLYRTTNAQNNKKALWVMSTTNLGELANNFVIEVGEPSKTSVGPWEGWDEDIALSYTSFSLGARVWHLAMHYEDLFRPRLTRGRSAIIRSGSKGRPRHNRLPRANVSPDQQLHSTLSFLSIAIPKPL